MPPNDGPGPLTDPDVRGPARSAGDIPPPPPLSTVPNPWARTAEPAPGLMSPPPPPPTASEPAPGQFHLVRPELPVLLPIEAPPSTDIGRRGGPPSSEVTADIGGRTRKRSWPRAAKATVALLTLATAGTAGWGISQTTISAHRADTIVALNDEVATAQAETKTLAAQITTAQGITTKTAADAEAKIAEIQATAAAAQQERDAAQATAQAYQGLFPIAVAAIVNSDPAGTYTLAAAPRPDCAGYADVVAACGVDDFPVDLSIVGDPAAGYTVSSQWFDPVALTNSAGTYTARGSLKADFVSLCDGVDVPTTIDVSLVATAATPASAGVLKATAMAGSLTISTEAQPTCSASSRVADIQIQAG